MPDEAPNPESVAPETPASGSAPAPSYETWLANLPADQKALVEQHTTGLRSALEKERTSAKEFQKKLGDLGKRAEKGSELERELLEAQSRLKLESDRAAFYENAPANNVKMTSTRAAYIVASSEKFIREDGTVDWKRMVEVYPDFFEAPKAAPPARGNAGAGTGNVPGAQSNMNDFIRGGR